MKRRNKIAAALLFAVSIPAVSTWAQNSLRSAYFLEGYTYRHQMNPAFASERNYVGLYSAISISAYSPTSVCPTFCTNCLTVTSRHS